MRLLEKLRQKAMDLPFQRVDKKLTHLTPEICGKGAEYYRGKRGVQHQPKYKAKLCHMLLDCGTAIPLPWAKKRGAYAGVSPIEAYCFDTVPGPGSAWATFGLARYPAEIVADYSPNQDDRFTTTRTDGGKTWWEFNYDKWRRYRYKVQAAMTVPERADAPFLWSDAITQRTLPTKLGTTWRFGSFCKTQYASDPQYGGLPNFIRCHLCVIRLLEHAAELGIKVDIDDEGHFGPANYSDDYREAYKAGREPTYVDHPATRSIKTLVQQVGDYNVMIAGLAGVMRDAAGTQRMELESPIFNFPNFEHLEADFHVGKAGDFDDVIKAFAALPKQELTSVN